jgi:hypothetical protein
LSILLCADLSNFITMKNHFILDGQVIQMYKFIDSTWDSWNNLPPNAIAWVS